MTRSDDLYALPANIAVPEDDGACDHLPGLPWPDVALPSTAGRSVSIGAIPAESVVVYFYPRTGRPDREPLGGAQAWNAIPGARGCTPQACSYRDHYRELKALGAEVFGVSTQDTAYQREAVERLHLPFELLSDERRELATALRLPTFDVEGMTLIKRLTLLVRDGRIARCFYPVFPPDADAERIIDDLSRHRSSRQ